MPNVYRKYDSKSGVWADFGDLNARKDIGIVEDTDIAEHSIASGQYVIWKGKLYTANSAITPDTTLSTSNLTEVTIGGLNSLKNTIDSSVNTINSNISALGLSPTYGTYTVKSGTGITVWNGSWVGKYGKIGVVDFAFIMPNISTARTIEVISTMSIKPSRLASINYIGEMGARSYIDITTAGKISIAVQDNFGAQTVRFNCSFLCS